jgi:hypothetical protein
MFCAFIHFLIFSPYFSYFHLQICPGAVEGGSGSTCPIELEAPVNVQTVYLKTYHTDMFGLDLLFH